MAYGVIQFVENGKPKVTLVRTERGQPTGADGVMDALSSFIEESAPIMVSEGSPGARRGAMLFFAREQQAGHDTRVLGADTEHGITRAEVEALQGRGYHYDVDFGAEGERGVPRVLTSGLERGQGGGS